MFYPELPPREPVPQGSSRGNEQPHFVPESVARLAVDYPEHFSSVLVEDGNYVYDGIRTKNTKNGRLKWANFTDITERGGETSYTYIQVTFPNMFSRGLARLRSREPLAIVCIEHSDILGVIRDLDQDDAYLDHPTGDSEDPEF